MLSSMYNDFITDFDTTFQHGSKQDIITVENFLKKYKTLIERRTNIIIEEIDPFSCVDFEKRIKKCYDACVVTKSTILKEKLN